MITTQEIDQILALAGLRLFPTQGFTGGATPATQKSVIAQTMPFQMATANTAGTTAVMNLTAIFLPAGFTITNINFVVGGSAEGTGTHAWFALYDDGRGSATANQLALLGQTADQTGASFMAANTNMGLALQTPYATSYSGVYYVALCVVASGTMPTMLGSTKGGTGATNMLLPVTSGGVANTGLFWAATAGSGLTTTAPNPSGALTAVALGLYAYVS